MSSAMQCNAVQCSAAQLNFATYGGNSMEKKQVWLLGKVCMSWVVSFVMVSLVLHERLGGNRLRPQAKRMNPFCSASVSSENTFQNSTIVRSNGPEKPEYLGNTTNKQTNANTRQQQQQKHGAMQHTTAARPEAIDRRQFW